MYVSNLNCLCSDLSAPAHRTNTQELIQTRLSVANAKSPAFGQARVGVRACTCAVIREHGWLGLWHGFGARVLLMSLRSLSLCCAVSLQVYACSKCMHAHKGRVDAKKI